MIQIGLPSAGENLCYNMYQMVLLSLVNRLGNSAVNAQVYAKSLISFSMVFSNASAMGTQIIVGHLVGYFEMVTGNIYPHNIILQILK